MILSFESESSANVLKVFFVFLGSAFGKQNEKRRKQRQLRRETRGAMKEVMKDSMFVQRTWLNEQIAKDRERKQKVKNIYSQLANQEGEVKKLKKTKYQLI